MSAFKPSASLTHPSALYGASVTKERLLAEIRRIADEVGEPPGQRHFQTLTGIARSSWYGRFWGSWGDALIEAGFAPLPAAQKRETAHLIQALAKVSRRLGHFPSYVETKLERKQDPTFPPHQAITSRLGHRAAQIAQLRRLATENSEFTDLLALLPMASESTAAEAPTTQFVDGAVYLLKLGRHYKIGHTTSVPRRHREIALELPEKPDVVHVIRTDDPVGIETYWHNSFASKRTNGEWFALSIDEVRAFKRRRTM